MYTSAVRSFQIVQFHRSILTKIIGKFLKMRIFLSKWVNNLDFVSTLYGNAFLQSLKLPNTLKMCNHSIKASTHTAYIFHLNALCLQISMNKTLS